MGYSDLDKLAINTIRVLAVRYLTAHEETSFSGSQLGSAAFLGTRRELSA